MRYTVSKGIIQVFVDMVELEAEPAAIFRLAQVTANKILEPILKSEAARVLPSKDAGRFLVSRAARALPAAIH